MPSKKYYKYFKNQPCLSRIHLSLQKKDAVQNTSPTLFYCLSYRGLLFMDKRRYVQYLDDTPNHFVSRYLRTFTSDRLVLL